MSLTRLSQHRVMPLIAVAALLVLGLLLYLPGLSGPFLFDDNHNFIQNDLVHMSRLDLNGVLDALFSAGGHFPYRGMSRLSFALHHYFSGGVLDPWVFKLTNVLIHLLNAVLVFALARALFMTQRQRYALSHQQVMWMAVLCASVWLLHPMQLTSVLYAVQRMTSLSAMFMFAGLLGYVYGRHAVQGGDHRGFVPMALGLCCGVLLGMLNKENAALLPFLAYVVHLAFFPTAALDPHSRRRLRLFHLLFVGSALLIAIIAVAWSWSGFLSTFELRREFSMGERLLTQPRVIFLYLSLLLFPSLGRMSLHHDDFLVSTGWLSPASTLIAIVVLAAVLMFAVYRLRSGSLWAFAVVFFLLGHALESSFLPLEMIYEHRNYLPSFALALLCGHTIVRFTSHSSSPVGLPVTISFVLVLGLSVVTWSRAGIWSNEAWLMRYMTEQHPNAYRALALKARQKAVQGGTPTELYTAYAAIADVKPSAIFALMRMRRLVNAMQFQLRQGTIPAVPASAASIATIRWDVSALYRDPEFLEKVADSLDVEIRRRLPLSPVSDETIAEFRQVRLCIDAALDLCIGIDDELKSWLSVALSQSRMETGARVRVLDELAWHHQRSGDYELAHGALNKATDLNPSSTIYQLRRVMLFTNRNKLDEAKALLRQIEVMERQTWFERQQARLAREMLAEKLKGESS
ncbi:MAG: tetratricopeptide (TPR) repeat protein [Gammaproteobacteria bacterium]